MNDLIARLEAAPEGSRELDAEIAVAVWPKLADYAPDTKRGPGHWISPKDGPVYAENYTTSIDDALTLVPEGRRFKVGRDDDGTGYASVGGPRIVMSATPALALCIACLRTREVSHD